MTTTTKQTNNDTKQVVMQVMEQPVKKNYDNEKTIVLFQNNQRTDVVKHPIMRGNFTLNGKIYNISLWSKYMIKNGEKQIYWKGEIEEQNKQENEINDLSCIMDIDQATAMSAKSSK